MSLAERLKACIKTEGPLPLELFLEKVMTTTQDSYYAEATDLARTVISSLPLRSASCLAKFWLPFRPGCGNCQAVQMLMR